jgi:hypothetical protein
MEPPEQYQPDDATPRAANNPNRKPFTAAMRVPMSAAFFSMADTAEDDEERRASYALAIKMLTGT